MSYNSDDIYFIPKIKSKKNKEILTDRYLDKREKFEEYILSKNKSGNVDKSKLATQKNLANNPELRSSILDKSSADIGQNSQNFSEALTTNNLQLVAESDRLLLQSKSFLQTNQRTGVIGESFIQTRKTQINIDSSDRIQSDWPDQNHYAIPLRQTFSNVVSIEMTSLEFPNTQTLIRETPSVNSNNKIYWYNEDDLIDAEPQLYIATVPAGNYTSSTLETAIETAMNSIRRIGTGEFHNIDVSINTETDVVSFTSTEYTTLTSPFTIGTTSSSSTEINIEYGSHPFEVGDRVVITGSDDEFGIDESFINTEHIVQDVVDASNFTIVVNAFATNDTSTTDNVLQLGYYIRWKLLWSNLNTIAPVLGFEEVDTEYGTVHNNTEETYNYYDDPPDNTIGERLKINEVYTTLETSSIYSLVRTTKDHLLETGDRIYFADDGDNVYDHLYGLSEGSLSTSDNNTRKRFVALLLDPAGHIITRISNDVFQITVAYEEITDIETQKDTAIVDGTEDFGDLIIKTLNTRINLFGYKYLFLCIPGFSNYVDTENVRDIFYKVQLAGASNSNIYNAFVGRKLIFYDSPYNQITDLEILWKTPDGNLFEFNDQDHSFTLEITESLQKIEGSGINARIGLRN